MMLPPLAFTLVRRSWEQREGVGVGHRATYCLSLEHPLLPTPSVHTCQMVGVVLIPCAHRHTRLRLRSQARRRFPATPCTIYPVPYPGQTCRMLEPDMHPLVHCRAAATGTAGRAGAPEDFSAPGLAAGAASGVVAGGGKAAAGGGTAAGSVQEKRQQRARRARRDGERERRWMQIKKAGGSRAPAGCENTSRQERTSALP